MVPPRCTLSMLSSYQNDSVNAQSLNYNPKMMVGLELSQPLPQHCMHPLMLQSPAGADLCERVWALQPPPNLKRPIWAIRLFLVQPQLQKPNSSLPFHNSNKTFLAQVPWSPSPADYMLALVSIWCPVIFISFG